MKIAFILLGYSFRRVRTLVFVLGALLAIFQVFLVIVARSIQTSNSFGQLGAMLPPFARELLGPSFTSFMSFQGIVSLGYFHLSVMGSLLGLSIALATTPASEIETGFMDLILSRSIARHWIITRSIALNLVSTVAVLAAMMLGTWIGLTAFAPAGVPWPDLKLILSLAANLGLLILCWGGIALTIGAVSRRRGVAAGISGVLALAAFLLDYVARAWQPAESIAWLSPFRYYSPLELLTAATLPVRNFLILAAAALGAFALAYLFFSRRDISH
ncbi:MAG TPA: ABC transporter permease subunit [Blastocatellia bacterium]|nr:ABC transporter permease subunit [Blastocatellia bacterium]